MVFQRSVRNKLGKFNMLVEHVRSSLSNVRKKPTRNNTGVNKAGVGVISTSVSFQHRTGCSLHARFINTNSITKEEVCLRFVNLERLNQVWKKGNAIYTALVSSSRFKSSTDLLPIFRNTPPGLQQRYRLFFRIPCSKVSIFFLKKQNISTVSGLSVTFNQRNYINLEMFVKNIRRRRYRSICWKVCFHFGFVGWNYFIYSIIL